MLEQLGGSVHKHKRRFVDKFGTEAELLKETDDRYMESQITVD